MNAGAAAAVGDVFFFLHADSFPPLNALGEIQRVLRDNTILEGAFEHRFAETVWSLRLISWINRRRYFLTRNYYGDQGIFVRAGIFRDLFMEDLDFSQRLKKLGRTKVIPLPLITSGRRFLTWGPWRALMRFTRNRDDQGRSCFVDPAFTAPENRESSSRSLINSKVAGGRRRRSRRTALDHRRY